MGDRAHLKTWEVIKTNGTCVCVWGGGTSNRLCGSLAQGRLSGNRNVLMWLQRELQV